MTQKQMAAFLRKEGWKPYKVSDGTYGIDGWRDTKEKHVLESLAPIELAYRLARRRKAQREGARLKRAGWRYFQGAWWHETITQRLAQGWVQGGITVSIPHSKAEALATLGGPHAQ
jgi:hypothetical protein